ncbi:MAG: DMT family transporter [Deltaproteobacteria bacterium]|nr:DMT family transporter [Deltaproteobacteria bacterium]
MSVARRVLPYAALFSAQVFFALWPTAGSAALKELAPAAIVGFRTLGGAFFLLLFARFLGRLRTPSLRDLIALFGLGILGVSANQLLFIQGLLHAGPVTAVMMIVGIPVFAYGFAVLLRHERATWQRALGAAIAAMGVQLLVRSKHADAGLDAAVRAGQVTGVLFFVANTSCYGLYLVLAKRVIARFGSIETLTWVFVFGAISALPWTAPALLATEWSTLSASVDLALVFILAGPTLGSYFLNAYALARVDSSVVAVFTGLQPLVGTFAAWLLLDARVTNATLAAGFVMVLGMFLVALPRRSALVRAHFSRVR